MSGRTTKTERLTTRDEQRETEYYSMKYDCDIVLLSYENPGLLKKCVESVLDSTRVRSRLIIVDNGSADPRVGNTMPGEWRREEIR